MKKIFIAFLSFILISCITANTSARHQNSSSTITFQTPNILDRMQTSYKFDLNVGIFAIDEKNIFLFGSLGEDESYPLQSTLLKSVDGGKHWDEVLAPQQTSRVIEFQMRDSGVGWVLILAINEGIGDSILFQTIDFGNSWQEISVIPRDNDLGLPTFMHFGSEQDGQIDVVYPYEMPNDGYLAHLSTYNGGKTWEETGRYYPKFEEMYSQSNITSGYWLYKKDYQESISMDRKSYWKIEEYNNELIIKRSLPEPVNNATGYTIWDEWEVISIFPITLSYENGMIKLP